MGCIMGCMEESLDELYQKFLVSRKNKLRELIEVQDQMSIAEEVSRIKKTQSMLELHLKDTDSPIAATKLSSEIRANSGFLMDIMGVGGEQMKQINQTAVPVLPNQQSAVQIGVIEGISFEEE